MPEMRIRAITQWAITSSAVFLAVTAYAPAHSQTPITLSPQAPPNSVEVRGTTGGDASVADLIKRTDSPTGPCTGFANPTPNHTLTLKGFFKSLSIQATSPEDTALVVRGPGGVWCNDDFQGKNPGVSGQWLPGNYEIWVSSYARNRTAPYVLRVKGE